MREKKGERHFSHSIGIESATARRHLARSARRGVFDTTAIIYHYAISGGMPPDSSLRARYGHRCRVFARLSEIASMSGHACRSATGRYQFLTLAKSASGHDRSIPLAGYRTRRALIIIDIVVPPMTARSRRRHFMSEARLPDAYYYFGACATPAMRGGGLSRHVAILRSDSASALFTNAFAHSSSMGDALIASAC